MPITIRNLMLLIAVVGLDLGAFTAAVPVPGGASDWARLFLVAMTTGLLAAAILGAALRTGVERATWLGMAVFGWAFLLPAIALTAGGASPEVRCGICLGAQAMAAIGGGVARRFVRDDATPPA